jgi:hypothetical protein
VRVSWRDMDGCWKKLAFPFMCGDPNECADVSAGLACGGYTCPGDEGEDRLGDLGGNEYGLGGDRGGRTWGDAWSIPGGLLGSIVKGSFRRRDVDGWVIRFSSGRSIEGGRPPRKIGKIGTGAVLHFCLAFHSDPESSPCKSETRADATN